MSTPNEHRPETIRAAKLALDVATASTWHGTRTTQEAIDEIACIIEDCADALKQERKAVQG